MDQEHNEFLLNKTEKDLMNHNHQIKDIDDYILFIIDMDLKHQLDGDFEIGSHASDVTSVVFHPDGNYFASGSKDKSIKVWNLHKNQEEFTLNGHLKGVNSVVFSPDGKFLLSGSSDKNIKIWNLQKTRKELTTKSHYYLGNSAFYQNRNLLPPIQNSLLENKIYVDYVVYGKEYSTNSKYLLIQSIVGFEIYELEHNEAVTNFYIQEYKDLRLKIQIDYEEIEFNLSKELIINIETIEILRFQKKHNCIIEISKYDINTNVDNYNYDKKFYQKKMDYLCLLNYMRKEKLSTIAKPKYHKVFIDDHFHTLAHIM